MKDIFYKIRWIAKYMRPFIPHIIVIITLGAILSLNNIYLALVSKQLIDSATHAQSDKMVQSLIILATILIVDVGTQALVSILSTHTYMKMCSNIQKRLYTCLTDTKWMELSNYHSGDILTRMTNDVDTLANVLVRTFPNIISLIVLLIGSFVTLLSFDPSLAILALILAPVPILFSRFYGRKLKNLYIKTQQIETKYRSFIQESIQNMVIIKSFCQEQNNILKLNTLQKDRLKLVLSRNSLSTISTSIFSLGSWVIFFLVFSWGSVNISKGIITFGELTALLQLASKIQYPFSGLASSLPQLVSTFASSERLMELENLNRDFSGFISPNLSSAGIHFENVTFDYKKNQPVLKNLSFIINPGEVVALIGPSGEGKTTLIRLLLSLIYPEKGYAYITNSSKKFEINASIRNLISYVPQGNTLFSGTIADNLRFGCPEATDIELETAARAACALEFIQNLQDGFNTLIGERGLGLSEGQAQRLAIARALLHKTPILVLDEATSALDTDTEIKVLEAVRSLKPSPTSLIITHRLTALDICNRVFKLENGSIVEQYDHISINKQCNL
ncbi:multidrug ABC transporter ATP-binding protein [Clostridium polyendosporum]|uniref:Multidrug ABC transporter ATP-binding protein n=1 Tax=Clostridium polyendosporum TaxID=69208 RepID=A0A919RZU7_9CLOT|nr:ABC transporter ATP-binding protein [Clostridium polyendosporum]GIM28736.1 multidrug ABC transporter ATP-binding protein [Clostridium polyendosporum]